MVRGSDIVAGSHKLFSRKYEAVDIHLDVIEIENGKENLVILNKNLKAKSTGSPCTVSFHLEKPIEKAKIVIKTQGHNKFEAETRVESNLAVLHIHTDKPIYSAGETVSVRALPLTYEGTVYDGVIDFALVNPNGFELVRKQRNTLNGYIGLMFELPKHLFYGEWQVIAKPKIKNLGQLVFGTKFEDYISQQKFYRIVAPYGFWQRYVDISMCILDGYHQATTILVRILDRGTGARDEVLVEVDPLIPGFEIISLRPAFSDHTKHLLFMTQSVLAPIGVEVDIRIECLGDVKQRFIEAKTMIGDVLRVVKPMDWHICHVIMIQAFRQVGLLKSRKKSLMLPRISEVKSMELSWIELSPLKNSYFVGEHLQVSIPNNISGVLDYVIVCDSYSMPASGVIKEASITVTFTRSMVGQCIFLVYTTGKRRTIDMIQFHVIENCQVSVQSSSNTIKPGASVTFTMNGQPYGFALMRAIDDRLNSFVTKNDRHTKLRFWNFGVFHQSEFNNRTNQTKLTNFIAYNDVKRVIEERCSSAAGTHFKIFGNCPDATRSLSEISNFCLSIMISECLAPVQPTVAVSTVCDMKNPRECNLSLKKATPILDNILLHRFHAAVNNSLSDLERVTGKAAMAVKAPDTVGRWSISSAFWFPGQRHLCIGRKIEITSTKDVFMEVCHFYFLRNSM
ncbi:hypothetical protein DICVIV_13567 [Dictyocaulus viviparus]|uniref:Uncharacterized protein n=1 Tax=Dictyocaulus viviparus TaxID=29172 RepID=A0A0D8X7F1_DICVI|nr:hypothetical protein DICVIV_13567 [Dictyocaulus viviparus]